MKILMIIALFMALAVLFGGIVLLVIFIGRKYEVRHNVGELDEEIEENEQLTNINKSANELNSKEKL